MQVGTTVNRLDSKSENEMLELNLIGNRVDHPRHR